MKQFLERGKLAWKILTTRDGNLQAHAKGELPKDEKDAMQSLINQHLLNLTRVFSAEGHSGFSASYTRNMLHLLLDFKPLGPLTGDPSEWVEVCEGTWQNNRCGHVFKDNSGVYDSESVIFEEPDGGCFQSSASRRFITFPYTPKRVYCKVPFDCEPEERERLAQIAWESR